MVVAPVHHLARRSFSEGGSGPEESFEIPSLVDRLGMTRLRSWDADGFRRDYLDELEKFRETYRRECYQSRIDYVPLDTSMRFDRALTEYLVSRSGRG